MPEPLPALNLIAQPGHRRATLDIAREIEQRSFAGISVSSQFSNMAQCLGLAFATERISFATAIAPIYAQTAEEFAQQAAYIHEVSGGRFQFGIGVAHAPSHIRMGVTPGKSLADIRAFVVKIRSYEGIGALPPIILAALRRRMVALAAEIGDGLVFANGSRSHMTAALGALPAAKRDDPNFFMITHYPQPARHGTKQEHRGCFCGFERWRATRCNFKRGSARPSLLFFTEQRIGAGRR